MVEDCIFCKIVKGEIPCQKIGEDEHFICFLDIQPISEGHALIVPKEHFKDLTEFPDNLDVEFFRFAKEMAARIVKTVGADGFNMGMNNGAAAGQVVMHQHTHIIPRFDDDGLTTWPSKEVTQEALTALKERLLE